MVLLEFGEALQAQGFEVDIYAHNIAADLATVFAQKNLTFKTANTINLKNYRLIYTQLNALTALMSEDDIGFMCENGFPCIIYGHLSPFVDMEAPLSRLEAAINTFIVANSQETKQRLLSFGYKDKDVLVVPNPTRHTYKNSQKTITDFKNIAIISNHVPPELLEARALLENDGLVVDIIGAQGTQQQVTPELLNAYDGIITIGKTVQMALLSKLPVYCYDHFGGPGWLTPQNFEKAADFNFSGRGFSAKKTADDIYTEIKNFTVENFNTTRSLYNNLGKYSFRNWVVLLKRFLVQYEPVKRRNVQTLLQYCRLDRSLSIICMQAFQFFYESNVVYHRHVKIIEDQNTHIQALTHSVADKDQRLAEHDSTIALLHTHIADRDQWVAERDATITLLHTYIADRDQWIAERDGVIAHLHGQVQERNQWVAERDASITLLQTQVTDRDKWVAERDSTVALMRTYINDRERLVAERDSAIDLLRGQVADRDQWVTERDATISQMHTYVSDRDRWIAERDNAITLLHTHIENRDKWIVDRNNTITQLRTHIDERETWVAERDHTITHMRAQIEERNQRVAERDNTITHLQAQAAEQQQCIAERDATIIQLQTRRGGLSRLMGH